MPQNSASASIVADTTGSRTVNGVTETFNQRNGHGRATVGRDEMLVRNPGATQDGVNGEVVLNGRTREVAPEVSATLLADLGRVLSDNVVSVREVQGFRARVEDAMDDGLLNSSVAPRPMVGDNMGRRRTGG